MKVLLPLFSLLLLGSSPPQKYCAPSAMKDYNLVIRYVAHVETPRSCRLPALVRKVTPSGAVLEKYRIDPGKARNIPLYIARLQYTLDGVNWAALRVR